MEIEQFDGTSERTVLAAMVTDTGLLARVAGVWPTNNQPMFGTAWADMIGGWCVNHYKKYNEAPSGTISTIYEQWADKYGDAETVELVGNVLHYISTEYASGPDRSTDYLIDLAGEFFRGKSLQLISERAAELAKNGETEEANKLLTTYQAPNIDSRGFSLLEDEERNLAAFSESTEGLIKYGGAIGEFFGDIFERDGFVAVTGPEKRGKSYWLQDIAWRGVLQRRRVAYFEVGDMSEPQVRRRFGSKIARIPLKLPDDGVVRVPVEIHSPAIVGGMAEVEVEERQFEAAITPGQANAAINKAIKQVNRSGDMLRLSCHPNSSINAMAIRGLLMDWARTGWVADVVIIDYADILAPPMGSADTRDQINGTWKALRRISQELHCCVVTATQADANSYDQELITRKNFTDDKRKHSHVTAMFALNQNDEEKTMGLMRLNFLDLRGDYFVESKCVHVAGCLRLGAPVIRSTF